ncbi:hypothetical protein [Sphingobium sp. B2]|uniref:hypothetical protein n=1 Tax=Sphingobium sp. B2 TaxID=2583228 RepID=UPI0011A9CEA2|nr:hypothetical protein [Sphingobium sp. B2]
MGLDYPRAARSKHDQQIERRLIPVVVGLLVAFSPGAALASEGGLSHYPTGVNTTANGMLPPPGKLQFYNYSQLYIADEVVDGHGQSVVPDFHAEIAVDAPRIVYTLSLIHISMCIRDSI